MSVELQTEATPAAFQPIECDYLDSENLAWASRYVELCKAKLESVEDERFAGYLQVEIAAYEELLERFKKPQDS